MIKHKFESFEKFKEFINNVENQTGHKVNPLSANFTKWLKTLKQFVGKLPSNCLSVFDHFVGLVLQGLSNLDVITQKNLFQMNLLTSVKTKVFNEN